MNVEVSRTGFGLEEKKLMKFLSGKSAYIPILISILLLYIKTTFVDLIYGYDWPSFPQEATYSVFAFYIWFYALYCSKEDLLGKLNGSSQIPANIYAKIMEISNEIFSIGKKDNIRVFPIIVLFHIFLFAQSFRPWVYELSSSICTNNGSGVMMLIIITIVYFIPTLLSLEWI